METVGRLVGAVAHDFANILTLIAGYSDIALNRIGDCDPLRPELDEIRKAANRGARLTSQLLGFTRGQAVQPRPLDLNSLVCEIERMLQLAMGECVELQLDLCPTLPKVLADPGQMEQVIMNLVLNARDAIPAGGRIRIETANQQIGDTASREYGIQPGAYVTLSITDDGHGIPADAMSHIFEPFFSTKEHGKGTGLGLNTVYRIVKEGGGGIGVNSVPGNGATFTVCLPQAVTEVQHPDTTGDPVKAEAGSETLLVVEDEDGVRRLLSHILQRHGYRVLEAANGEEAVDLFQKRAAEIRLVLTDMVMPRMSGRQLSELIHRIRPGVKVMYMSGYTDDMLLRAGALSPGMNFLQKPLRPEVLAAKVREVLDAA
jgi:CheY-like chemotaxis protein